MYCSMRVHHFQLNGGIVGSKGNKVECAMRLSASTEHRNVQNGFTHKCVCEWGIGHMDCVGECVNACVKCLCACMQSAICVCVGM